ncbi:MAG TPA: hypothetical protein VK619_12015, partial [Pyrinomonadaceae bacterium]|nr:hypothetical protein [Pyrinomonadaceae bacterium]
MALEQVKLDDLTWAEMVTSIRRRIPADSGGSWTLHAPVDPGMTLLELFAWLLEQRVYWLDQIPCSLVRTALRLLGESTRPTQPAATVLQFPPDSFKTIQAKTEMRRAESYPAIIFSTDEGVTLLPVAEYGESKQSRVSLYVAGQDRTQDLRQGRVVPLFPSDGSRAEIKIVFWLTEQLQNVAHSEPFSLLFQLETSSSIPAQWSPDAVEGVNPPATITFYYSTAANQLGQFTAEQVDDGTGGLRRSGVLRLPIPEDWSVDESIGKQNGLFPYSLMLRTAKSTFTAPPSLVRFVPNVVIAHHRRLTQLHHLTRAWLPLPGNVVALSNLPEDQPDKDYPPLEETVKLRIRERDDHWHCWQPTLDLALHGPDERVFIVDRKAGTLRFGDGLTGRLPVLAKIDEKKPLDEQTNLLVQYEVGGGAGGNLGSSENSKNRTGWEGVGVANQDLTAQNVVPGIGGAEAETVDEARQRVTAEFRERNRAITRFDHETIAVTTPGVAFSRAHAAIGFHPGHPCSLVPGAMTVFVVPEAPREEIFETDAEGAFVAAPVPDPGALAMARARFERARLVASELFVSAPRYRKVSLTVEVNADIADPLAMRQRINDRLKDFLDPLLGGDDGTGWPFGEPLRPSALLREAQQALGEEGEVMA